MQVGQGDSPRDSSLPHHTPPSTSPTNIQEKTDTVAQSTFQKFTGWIGSTTGQISRKLKQFVKYKIGSPFTNFIISKKITDSFPKNILEQQKERITKNFGPVYTEFGRVLTQYIFSYVHHYIVHIEQIDPELHPTWLDKLLDREIIKDITQDKFEKQSNKNVRYAFAGTIIEHILRNHPNEAQNIIEYNILCCIEKILVHVKACEDENPNFFLDTLFEIFRKVGAEYEDYNINKKTKKQNREIQNTQDASIHEDILKGLYKTWSRKVFEIAMPNPNSITLPNSLDIQFIKNDLHDTVQNLVFPELFKDVVEHIRSDEGRDGIFVSILTFIKNKLSGAEAAEIAPNSVLKTEYPDKERFHLVFQKLFKEFFDFTSPETFQLGTHTFLPKKISKSISESIIDSLSHQSILPYLEKFVKTAIKSINPGGKWEKDIINKPYKFNEASYQFPKTKGDIQRINHNKKLAKDITHQKMETLFQETVLDYTGIYDAIQQSFFHINSRTYKKLCEDNDNSFFHSLGRGIKKIWYRCTRWAVTLGCRIFQVDKKITNLVKNTLPKARNQLNARFTCDIFEAVFDQLNKK